MEAKPAELKPINPNSGGRVTSNETAASSIRSLNYSQLIEQATSPVEYLIEEYIPARSLGILVGDWGIGKSPFALQLQLSMVCNQPFLGRFAALRPGLKCLYIDMENGLHSVLGMTATITGFIGSGGVPETWTAYSPNYAQKPAEYDQLPEDVYITRMILEERPDLVVIDPLRMFKPDAESKNSEAALLIRRFRRLIKVVGCSILLIHHPRKLSGSEIQSPMTRPTVEKNPSEWMMSACGAAALVQNTDFRIGLEQNEEGILVCRRFIRNRGWSPAEYIDRAYDDNTDEPKGYFLLDGLEVIEPLERDMLRTLGPAFTTADVKRVSGKKNKAANDLLKRWFSFGVIKKTERGVWRQTTLDPK